MNEEWDFYGDLNLKVDPKYTPPWSGGMNAKQIMKDILYWKKMLEGDIGVKSDYVLNPSPPVQKSTEHTKTNGMQDCWCGESHIFKGVDADGNPYNPEDFA